MKKCPNGHSYDENQHKSCPDCNSDSLKSFNVTRNVMSCVYGPPKNRPDMKLHAMQEPEKKKGLFSKLFKK